MKAPIIIYYVKYARPPYHTLSPDISRPGATSGTTGGTDTLADPPGGDAGGGPKKRRGAPGALGDSLSKNPDPEVFA